jgi:hypothetical protein
MTVQRFVVGAAVVGLIVLTVVLYLGSLGSVHTARINSFQRTGDPRKIVVNVIIGYGIDVAERTVREGPQSVSVTVAVRQNPGVYPLVAFVVPVLVSLKDPLGDRAVLDQDGHAVRDAGDFSPPGVTPAP